MSCCKLNNANEGGPNCLFRVFLIFSGIPETKYHVHDLIFVGYTYVHIFHFSSFYKLFDGNKGRVLHF